MIAVLRTPARRIATAAALSILAHAIILWLPSLHFPRSRVQLPPLTARLELLPTAEKKEKEKSGMEQFLSAPGDGASSGQDAAETMKKMNKSAATEPRLFPKHLQLKFTVYKGEGGLRSGEINHRLDISGDRYTLRAAKQEAGLAGAQFVQTSYGRIGDSGLRPEIFEEETVALSGRHGEKATFRWNKRELDFSQGGHVALPDGAQDALSFMYQLSQLSMKREFIPFTIADGSHLEDSPVEIGAEENIDTPMGKVRALHLRKMHDRKEAYFEIWLGTEYRLLPVKFRRVDASGAVIEEFAITDIRASDK